MRVYPIEKAWKADVSTALSKKLQISFVPCLTSADNGVSGKRFDRPAFQQMIQDVLAEKIECIVVKDLSRLGRDHLAVSYYLEIFFPQKHVRLVSVNDQFDTFGDMDSQNKGIPILPDVRIPLINLFNEQVSVETKIAIIILAPFTLC